MFIFGLFLIEFKNVNIDFKGFLEIKFYFCCGFFLCVYCSFVFKRVEGVRFI